MRCLLIRQPYASLITHGYKRIEFRSSECNISDPIIIGASKGPPIISTDDNLNKISKQFPKGKLLNQVSWVKDAFFVYFG